MIRLIDTQVDFERRIALVQLLALPAIDALTRRHHVTCPGDPRRRERVLLPLMTRWAQYRHLDVDPAPYIAPAKPAYLHGLRRTA